MYFCVRERERGRKQRSGTVEDHILVYQYVRGRERTKQRVKVRERERVIHLTVLGRSVSEIYESIKFHKAFSEQVGLRRGRLRR